MFLKKIGNRYDKICRMSTVEVEEGQRPGWKAPRREYGGEDLQEYFAVMFAKQIVAVLFSDKLFRKKSH